MIPEQIWDMIQWSGILVVGISIIGFWVQRIISFLTEDSDKVKVKKEE